MSEGTPEGGCMCAQQDWAWANFYIEALERLLTPEQIDAAVQKANEEYRRS